MIIIRTTITKILPSHFSNQSLLGRRMSQNTIIMERKHPVEGIVSQTLRKKISEHGDLQPISVLEIVNESHLHNVPPHSETHFKLFIVSSAFQNQNLLARHRMIHKILHSELDKAHGGPIHALSMICKTPQQWEQDKLEHGWNASSTSDGNDPTPTSTSRSSNHDIHDLVVRTIMGESPKCRGGEGSLPKKRK